MLGWVVIFLIISVIAGALGFTRVSAASAGVAEVIFSFFLVLFFVVLALLVAHV